MSGSGEQPEVADPLGEALAAAVRRTGARSGGVYLLDPAETAMCLLALCGLPVDAFAPWWRMSFAIRGPAQDAIRHEQLVWVSSLEALARAYPRAAATIPYQVAFAIVPLKQIRHCRGALLLIWAPDRSPASPAASAAGSPSARAVSPAFWTRRPPLRSFRTGPASSIRTVQSRGPSPSSRRPTSWSAFPSALSRLTWADASPT
ncbi:hypothetical protein WKI71_42120 [Streptomyces sp. MS1.AVA.1]|uniref:Uncharacterized protein n=1 Tax=Streptomyces machairae TaxID=3134109 RepID=A0ABU8UUG3_9ACTN